MRKLIRFKLLMLCLLMSTNLPAKCPSQLSFLGGKTKKIGLLGLAGLMIGISPHLYHDLQAAGQDMKHLGAGIYLDMETVRKSWHPQVDYWLLRRDQTSDPQLKKAFELIVVRYLADEFHGDYAPEDEWPKLFPAGRTVSSYMKGNCNSRGVCRHKSIALNAVLNELGIRSQIHTFTGPELMHWHAWNYLVDYDLIIDSSTPLRDIVLDPSGGYAFVPKLQTPNEFVENFSTQTGIAPESVKEYSWKVFGILNADYGGILR